MERFNAILMETRHIAESTLAQRGIVGDEHKTLAYMTGWLAQTVANLEAENQAMRGRYQEEIEGRSFLAVERLEVK